MRPEFHHVFQLGPGAENRSSGSGIGKSVPGDRNLCHSPSWERRGHLGLKVGGAGRLHISVNALEQLGGASKQGGGGVQSFCSQGASPSSLRWPRTGDLVFLEIKAYNVSFFPSMKTERSSFSKEEGSQNSARLTPAGSLGPHRFLRTSRTARGAMGLSAVCKTRGGQDRELLLPVPLRGGRAQEAVEKQVCSAPG